ncbi:MAG: right-handed parallel beta-helix repeat-containing protein [Chloroflexi bacterium]|nr:right-handed parallel beta-helix repeat-containing protein [Chloroflexota bacterium]
MTKFQPQDYYIAPEGNDRWTGKLAEVAAGGKDGPFRTIAGARRALSALKAKGKLSGACTVWLRGGRYPMTGPVEFGPEDSMPVTYAAYPGETPILDGGVLITGWEPGTINGQAAWIAPLPQRDGSAYIPKQLFVNGERRSRSRLPKNDFYWVKEIVDEGWDKGWNGYPPSHSFILNEGDFKPWVNLQDIDIVAPHYWIEERLPVESFDPVTNKVVSARRSAFGLKDDWADRLARYYIENVREAVLEPGEWYADRSDGKLYYIPKPGETIDSVEAYICLANQLLVLKGDPDTNQFVEYLRFEGLTFEHTEWIQPDYFVEQAGLRRANLASAAQAAMIVPGVIVMEGARYCAIEDCTIQHIGWYGIELADGCQGIRLVGNTITDMGGGGIKLNGSDAKGALCRRTGHNTITDNEIGNGGIIFHAAVGVLSRHSAGNTISHNHIHDLYYTGISVGWVWGYAESVSINNTIEKNYIHDLGKRLLSDMGGIYLLGVAPGTVLRGNLIHDIEKWNYGGWAIYPDEGSSHLLIENNIGYNTSSQPFHQHYGMRNLVRNNIWAFGREGQVRTSRVEGHQQIIFERNIVVTNGQPVIIGGYPGILDKKDYWSDLNLFWDVSGAAPITADIQTDEKAIPYNHTVYDMDAWHAMGFDRHSIMADPKLADPANGDFTIAEDSPALEVGFVPFDLADVGPRPKGSRC